MRQALGHIALVACYLTIGGLMAAAVAGAFWHGPRRRPSDPLHPFEAAPGEDCR